MSNPFHLDLDAELGLAPGRGGQSSAAAPPVRRSERPYPIEMPIVAAEAPTPWREHAAELAAAAMAMANRTDCCGGYRGRRATTRKSTDADWLPLRRALVSHFRGERPIGLHAGSPHVNLSRWIAIDLDSHDGQGWSANLHAARVIAGRLRNEGLHPFVFSSDGRGGLHVWAALAGPSSSASAHRLAQRVTADLHVPAETFPRQPHIEPGKYGNWIRLLGRHYKRDHWSTLWTGERWATADETVRSLLSLFRGEPCPIPTSY